MKICRAAWFFAVSVSTVLSAADTAIEFSGVLTAEGKTRLALTDKAKKTTTWVQAGDEFAGYTVARYDAKEDAVYLRKGGQETRIGLVASRTPDPRAAATTATPANTAAQANDATAAAVRANLRLLAATARQYQATRGVSAVSYADLVGPGKVIADLKPIAGENYSTLNFGPNVTAVSVTTANGTTVTYDLNQPSSTATPNATVAQSPAAAAPANATPAPMPTPPPAATPTAASAAASDAALPSTGRQPASPSYMIHGGDTWEKVSAATGVSIQQLKQLNPAILEGSPLPAGQTIRVR